LQDEFFARLSKIVLRVPARLTVGRIKQDLARFSKIKQDLARSSKINQDLAG
jgi:hypothetical protein